MGYQTLFRDIEKYGDMGYFKDIDWIRVYIISPCTKSRMLLSMLHGITETSPYKSNPRFAPNI